MHIDRFVEDAEELAETLLRRFRQEKLFLVGHSWGSILGVYLSARRPDLIWAYIGIGQVAHMARGEQLERFDPQAEGFAPAVAVGLVVAGAAVAVVLAGGDGFVQRAEALGG